MDNVGQVERAEQKQIRIGSKASAYKQRMSGAEQTHLRAASEHYHVLRNTSLQTAGAVDLKVVANFIEI